MAQHIVTVSGEIRLGQFLKLANLAESGADARELIASGDVSVDGEVETRRGRRLVAGNVVTLMRPTGPVRATVAEG
ncbi:MAG TPA: RNA-binding S4 domain-containing protein [Actinomycetaceae bacterium]|nr:RNA-binding S4 domain-containing protein [Actinomycetaceae bacterium]